MFFGDSAILLAWLREKEITMKKENFKRTQSRESGKYAEGWDLVYLNKNSHINISHLISLILLPLCLVSCYLMSKNVCCVLYGLMLWAFSHVLANLIVSEIISHKNLPIIKNMKNWKSQIYHMAHERISLEKRTKFLLSGAMWERTIEIWIYEVRVLTSQGW